MPLFFKKAPTILGLDISSTAVKLLELSRNGDRYRVESYAVEPLTAGAVVEKNIVDVEAVGAGISRAVKRARTRAKNAAVAVSGSAVITKTIYMPAGLTDEEMATQIELEASQYIPYPLEDVNLDFQVLGPAPRDPNMVEVLLAASRSENVDSRVAAIELGGLTTSVVDIEAYTAEHLISVLGQALPKGANQIIAVVDLGATTSGIHVLDKLKLVYSREQSFGNKQLLETVQSRYGLSPEEAAKAVRQGGGGLPADYASEVLEPFKEAVAQHISRSLQFFLSSSPYHNVDHILLAGGTALLPGLAALTESTIGTPASVANPFAGMTFATRVDAKSFKNDAPILLTACGLAMRGFAV